MALINYYRKVLYLSHVVSEQVPGKDNCPLSYCIHAEKVLTDLLSTQIDFFFIQKEKSKRIVCILPRPF